MSEAVSLASLKKTDTVRVPTALHIGQLPKVPRASTGARPRPPARALARAVVVRASAARSLSRSWSARTQTRAHARARARQVGRFGPGAFMVLEYLPLQPFGRRVPHPLPPQHTPTHPHPHPHTLPAVPAAPVRRRMGLLPLCASAGARLRRGSRASDAYTRPLARLR